MTSDIKCWLKTIIHGESLPARKMKRKILGESQKLDTLLWVPPTFDRTTLFSCPVGMVYCLLNFVFYIITDCNIKKLLFLSCCSNHKLDYGSKVSCPTIQ